MGELAGLQWIRTHTNFRRRAWLPALEGSEELGRASIQPDTHFHDLRHTHKTWLIEDQVPRVLQLQRMGHKPKDTADHYSHVTQIMVDGLLAKLQERWEQYSTWAWSTHRADGMTTTETRVWSRWRAPQMLPTTQNG